MQDLLRYARFHLGDGRAPGGDRGRLLSSETLALMQTPQVTVWGSAAWGLPWSLTDAGGARQVSHGGGTKGQISLLALVPEHDFALVVLTNAGTGGKLYDEVRRWVLREYLGLEDPKPEAIEASEADLAQYAGRYRGYASDWELGLLNGRLVGQQIYKRGFPNETVPTAPPPPPVTLGLSEQDRLLVLDGPGQGDQGDIVRTKDGAIGWLRIGGRLHVRED